MTEIGPHLLGRIVSPPDDRDFRLENFVAVGDVEAGTVDPAALATLAISELKKTTVTYAHWAASVYPDVTATHWFKALNALAQIQGVTPPPPTGSLWLDSEPVLDQGNYGTCVGNGEAQFGNTLPYDDRYTEKDARAIYYEATVLDGSPDDPDAPGGGQQGATVRSGEKAMKNRGRIASYAMTTSLETAKDWLATKGPIVVGTDWMNDMFNPDAQGFVKPTGGVAGGHCYLLIGYDPAADAFIFLNSWGAGWGLNGRFKMRAADFGTLMNSYGEMWTAVELAV